MSRNIYPYNLLSATDDKARGNLENGQVDSTWSTWLELAPRSLDLSSTFCEHSSLLLAKAPSQDFSTKHFSLHRGGLRYHIDNIID